MTWTILQHVSGYLANKYWNQSHSKWLFHVAQISIRLRIWSFDWKIIPCLWKLIVHPPERVKSCAPTLPFHSHLFVDKVRRFRVSRESILLSETTNDNALCKIATFLHRSVVIKCSQFRILIADLHFKFFFRLKRKNIQIFSFGRNFFRSTWKNFRHFSRFSRKNHEKQRENRFWNVKYRNFSPAAGQNTRNHKKLI